MPAPESKPQRPETILIVDSSLVSRRLVRLILDREGYRILMAKDLDRALALCRGRIPIDLLIVDPILRTRQGKLVAECFHELRSGTPVLFMSGHALQELLAKGVLDVEPFREGKAGFLEKPFTVAGLVEIVSKLLIRGQPRTFTAR